MNTTMDIPLDADVICRDGDCGHSIELVLDPKSEELTHVVVKENHPTYEERLVPVEYITGSTPDLIQLNVSKEEFEKFDIFCRKELIPEELPNDQVYDAMGNYYVVPSMKIKKNVLVEYKSVPKGTLAFEHNAPIKTKEGTVGRLDELMIDEESDEITHLVMREGHLWGKKEVSIPISAIDNIDENGITLKLSKDQVKNLPEIPIRR